MANETVAAIPAVDGRKASKAPWAILAAMGFGSCIAMMFSTVIGPALLTIKADLGLSQYRLVSVAWVWFVGYAWCGLG